MHCPTVDSAAHGTPQRQGQLLPHAKFKLGSGTHVRWVDTGCLRANNGQICTGRTTFLIYRHASEPEEWKKYV